MFSILTFKIFICKTKNGLFKNSLEIGYYLFPSFFNWAKWASILVLMVLNVHGA